MGKILCIILPVLVFAQDYVLQKDLLSAGGRKMTSTDYVLHGSIGQTAIGTVEDTDYRVVIGFWHPPEGIPPSTPYIVSVEKSGNDVILTWNKIDTDTLGNPEAMHYYVLYRNTTPSFIPGAPDSIGNVEHPETTYTDAGVLNAGESYYYLIKAVDWARNKSRKSNMGYKFNKFVNENLGASDRNWVSLPWHSGYATVSDLTSDLSQSGDPLISITNLRDDQFYESWLWDPDFLEWYGTNFAIASGRGYEFETIVDTILLLVGSNNPSGLILLNENPDASNRNWISIPYNAVYSTVSDITTEYSPLGDPLISITNLRDDQFYESWLWDPDFLEWYGTNFTIAPGRGYEFETIVDTTWNPTEYSNEAKQMFVVGKLRPSDLEVYLGQSTEPDRRPVWLVEDSDCGSVTSKLKERVDYLDAKVYEPVSERNHRKYLKNKEEHREVGISHVVRVHMDIEGFEGLAFTAYRSDRPCDVLTENIIGSGIAKKGSRGAMWFDVGNFKKPWHNGQEVIVIIEATKADKGYFNILNFALDKGVDIQELDDISFVPIPKPHKKTSSAHWDKIDNDNIIGYSIYQKDRRLNEKVITNNEYAIIEDVIVKPVIKGGYETVYSSQGPQSTLQKMVPVCYSCTIYPNPFVKKAGINYAIPHPTFLNIKLYDVSGREVKTLISEKCEPGYYQIDWHGDDNIGRKVSAGIYFIRMYTEEFESQHKVIFVH